MTMIDLILKHYIEELQSICEKADIDGIVSVIKDIFYKADNTYYDKSRLLENYYNQAIFYLLTQKEHRKIIRTLKRKLDKAIPMVCQRNGSFKAYKIVLCEGVNFLKDGDVSRTRIYALAELYIPERARRSSAFGNKCRCDLAKVVKITRLDTKEEVSYAVSKWDSSFEYQVGSYVKPFASFNTDRFVECGSGIHFFITPEEAINYVM